MIDTKTAADTVYLAACAVNEQVPDQDRCSAMDLDAVYLFARKHMIRAVVAYALESAGVGDANTRKYIAGAIRKTLSFQQVWDEIKGKLEQEGIWYMPLKGSVLKDLYPQNGMREFADYDILIDHRRSTDVKNVMESIGFNTEQFGKGHHDVYLKQPFYNFEMHTALFGAGHDERFVAYYQDVYERLSGDGYEKRFLPEDFYLYLLAHEYKHYDTSGTGLRSLLDTYVYLNHQTLNMAYVQAEAEKLGIRNFEKRTRSLAQHLFGNEEMTASEKEMLEYILSSGTYGNITNRIQNKMRKKKWNRLWYMLDRFSVPVSKKNKLYAAYAAQYPFFYTYKVFLPVLPVYRTVRSMKEGRFLMEARAIRDIRKADFSQEEMFL